MPVVAQPPCHMALFRATTVFGAHPSPRDHPDALPAGSPEFKGRVCSAGIPDPAQTNH